MNLVIINAEPALILLTLAILVPTPPEISIMTVLVKMDTSITVVPLVKPVYILVKTVQTQTPVLLV